MNQTISKKVKDKIVLALDVDTKEEALILYRELKDYVGTFKVGLQLFMSEGFEAIKLLQDEGANIFFDVKLHDIPNTTSMAGANIVKKGISFFNIHTTGSFAMMQETATIAKKTAIENNMPTPTILGVTILSSINQQVLVDELEIATKIEDYVVNLAKLAKKSGLTGVVASVLEAKKIREACGKDFVILCPGIRPSFADVNDQQRIATPAAAIQAGADYLVIGRAVTASSDRLLAMQKVHKEIENSF
jgi:orotidine-5'-phosphate decarboxylase